MIVHEPVAQTQAPQLTGPTQQARRHLSTGSHCCHCTVKNRTKMTWATKLYNFYIAKSKKQTSQKDSNLTAAPMHNETKEQWLWMAIELRYNNSIKEQRTGRMSRS